MPLDTLSYVWLGALVVFLIIEGATAGLATIWFAAGALAALVIQLLGGKLWLQAVVFLVVSLTSILLLRPLAKKGLVKRKQATNADRVFEMVGVVQEDIDNIMGKGLVKLDGKVWTARSFTGMPIPAGTLVHPKMIEGVKLIVIPVQEPMQTESAK